MIEKIIEQVGITQHQVRREAVGAGQCGQFLPDRFLGFFRQRRSFVQQTARCCPRTSLRSRCPVRQYSSVGSALAAVATRSCADSISCRKSAITGAAKNEPDDTDAPEDTGGITSSVSLDGFDSSVRRLGQGDQGFDHLKHSTTGFDRTRAALTASTTRAVSFSVSPRSIRLTK
jgi:hypothetical protein